MRGAGKAELSLQQKLLKNGCGFSIGFIGRHEAFHGEVFLFIFPAFFYRRSGRKKGQSFPVKQLGSKVKKMEYLPKLELFFLAKIGGVKKHYLRKTHFRKFEASGFHKFAEKIKGARKSVGFDFEHGTYRDFPRISPMEEITSSMV
jgi:hypothetical protein